jgi:hypothetical protein
MGGDQSLRQRFPRLFGISTQKDEVICNLGSVVDRQWQWRRNLFVWEHDQYHSLTDIISPFMPTTRQDRWLWLGDELQGFKANSAYLLLVNEFIPPSVLDATQALVFKNLWKCGAPSKVYGFSWQLLLDRIQTKDNLVKRRILQIQQCMCVLCGSATETAAHLFLHCDLVAKV